VPVLVPHLQQGNLTRYLEEQRVTDAVLRQQLQQASLDAEERVRRLAGREGIGARVRAAQLSVARIELAKIVDGSMAGPVTRAIEDGIKRSAETAGVSFFRILDVLEGQLGKIPGLREGIIVQARRGAEHLISRGMNNIPLSRQVYRTGALAKDQLYRTINSMVASGSSWSELAAEARRFISPFTQGGVGYAAKRLARTELNNAFHTTQIRTTLKNPFVEGYKWQLSGSHPRPDLCNVYADHNGTGIFSKANVPGKPHPNCLCFLLYVTPSVEEFQNRFLTGGYDKWLDEFIEENVPHLSSALKKSVKARPQPPVKRVQKRAAPQQRAPERPWLDESQRIHSTDFEDATVLRERLARELADDPEYQRWLEIMDSWTQDFDTVNEVRRHVLELWKGASREGRERANTILTALEQAEANAPRLYRGVGMKKTEVPMIRPGQEIDINMSSFSANKEIGEDFAEFNIFEDDQVGIVYEVEPGAQALNISPYAAEMMIPQVEWITAGRYQVRARVFDKAAQVWRVKLRQIGTFTR
jgi:hypothetical protein